jgi:hypothetical protein
MPVMRIGYDDSIGSTLGNMISGIGAGWDPKSQLEAYLLQQQITARNRAIVASRRYNLTPEQQATIENMYRSGASQEAIDSELARYSPIARQETGLSGNAAADYEKQRQAGLAAQYVDDPSPAAQKHNRDVYIQAYGQEPAGGIVNAGPVTARYIAELNAGAKEDEAAATARGEATIKGVQTKDTAFPMMPGSLINPPGGGPPPQTPPSARATAEAGYGQGPYAKTGGPPPTTTTTAPPPPPPAQPSGTGPFTQAPPQQRIVDPNTGTVTFMAPPEKAIQHITTENAAELTKALQAERGARVALDTTEQIRALSNFLGVGGQRGVNATIDANMQRLGLSAVGSEAQARQKLNALFTGLKDNPYVAPYLDSKTEASRLQPAVINSITANIDADALTTADIAQRAAEVGIGPGQKSYDDFIKDRSAATANIGKYRSDKQNEYDAASTSYGVKDQQAAQQGTGKVTTVVDPNAQPQPQDSGGFWSTLFGRPAPPPQAAPPSAPPSSVLPQPQVFEVGPQDSQTAQGRQ